MTGIGLGPQSANYSLTRPATDPVVSSGLTWFKDSSGPGKKDGTIVDASFLNTMIAQLRSIVGNAGLTLSDTNDDLLSQSVQTGKLNVAVPGGTSSALTGTLTPAPAALTDGLSVTITPSFALSPGATFNLNGSGNIAITGADGSAVRSGDTVAGAPMRLVYSASLVKWVLTSQPRVASHAVAFQANTTNITTLANATVTLSKFTNVVFDTNSAYSPSTGLFTAPVAGVYQVNASFFFQNVANPTLVYINKNGSVIAESSVNGYARVLTTSVAVNCAVGDAISVTVSQSSGSSMSITSAATGETFSAAYIGSI